MPPSTAYRELWGDQQVLPVLCSILGVPSCPWGSVSAALRPLGLRPTASFVTWRRGAGLGAGLRVELDQTDFGYGLGELEQLVGTPEDVPAARDTVEGLCRALGEPAGGTVGHLGSLWGSLGGPVGDHGSLWGCAGRWVRLQGALCSSYGSLWGCYGSLWGSLWDMGQFGGTWGSL